MSVCAEAATFAGEVIDSVKAALLELHWRYFPAFHVVLWATLHSVANSLNFCSVAIIFQALMKLMQKIELGMGREGANRRRGEGHSMVVVCWCGVVLLLKMKSPPKKTKTR